MFWWIPHARVFGPVISSREPTNIHQLNPNIHILVEFPYYNSLNILVKNASLQLVGSSAVLVGSSPGKGFRVSNAFWGQMAQKKTTGMSSGCFQHFRCPQEILNSWIVHIWFTYDKHAYDKSAGFIMEKWGKHVVWLAKPEHHGFWAMLGPVGFESLVPVHFRLKCSSCSCFFSITYGVPGFPKRLNTTSQIWIQCKPRKTSCVYHPFLFHLQP